MRVIRLVVVVAAALLLGSPLRAQVLEWASCYDEPGDYQDRAGAVAVDSAGHVYVNGGSEQFGGGNPAYVTIKYAPDGGTLWVRRFPALGGGESLALDDSGNVYVTGVPVTIKYGPDGDTLWTYEDGAAYYVSLALDRDGNLVAAGDGPSSIRAIELTPDGSLLWQSTYNGPGGDDDDGHDMALDSEGHVVVAGRSWGLTAPGDGTQWNYTTVKLDGETGDTLWARHYNGPAPPEQVPTDIAFAVAVDRLDNVYVSGWSDGAAAPAQCHTIKYGPGGDVVWERRYAGGGACYDLLYDGGALYAVARRGDGDRVLKYDLEGNLVWARLHAVPVTFATNPPRLAADAAGNVYLMSLGAGPTRQDYAVVKYTPEGARAWTFVYPGTGESSTNAAYGLAVDAAANVYVTGGSSGPVCPGANFDYLTVKLSPDPTASEPGPPPSGFALGPARPNPSRGSTSVAYELPRAAHVTLRVYDPLGRVVATLVDGPKPAGRHEAAFDASALPAGTYFVRAEANGAVVTRPLTVLR